MCCSTSCSREVTHGRGRPRARTVPSSDRAQSMSLALPSELTRRTLSHRPTATAVQVSVILLVTPPCHNAAGQDGAQQTTPPT
jgi:hypothetical protein